MQSEKPSEIPNPFRVSLGAPSWSITSAAKGSHDHLDPQARRAFAIFYALNLANNTSAIYALLEQIGETPRQAAAFSQIGAVTCRKVARLLRERGYPLDDEGIARFKMERGFSGKVRIGPEVAAAYAGFLRGVEARLNITDSDWHALGEAGKRALQVLMQLGRCPELLEQVRRALGIRNGKSQEQGVILVGKASALRLVDWTNQHGMPLTKEGVARLCRQWGLSSDQPKVLADFLCDAILSRSEPPHDYTQVLYQQKPVNRRTACMLTQASTLLPPEVRFKVRCGSYQTRAHKGAHPHMGGGAVDLEPVYLERFDEAMRHAERILVALRSVGFAAWIRHRQDQPLHVHAIAIGDREMSASAAWQVREYLAGRDGRTRGETDPHAHLAIVPPSWVSKYAAAQAA